MPQQVIKMRWMLFVLLAFVGLTSISYGKTYEWIGPNGIKQFGDAPPPGVKARVFNLQTGQTSATTSPPEGASQKNNQQTARTTATAPAMKPVNLESQVESVLIHTINRTLILVFLWVAGFSLLGGPVARRIKNRQSGESALPISYREVIPVLILLAAGLMTFQVL